MIVFAIGAHPDDIEFMMGGTLLLLKQAGCVLHYLTIANGSCGSAKISRSKIIEKRTVEARNAAEFLGAHFHKSLVNDIDIFYEKKLIARVGAIIREVKPTVLLVPSPEDYMEDHANTSRLAVTAAFCKGMRNFSTQPKTQPVDGNLTLYHALPYGLRDGLRRTIRAGEYVDITSVISSKRKLLALHQSQKEWLDVSQGLDSYLNAMELMATEVGKFSKYFKCAEGWRRHNHLGFSDSDIDPLYEALGRKVVVDELYEKELKILQFLQ